MTAFQDSPAVYLKLVDVSYGSSEDCDRAKNISNLNGRY